MCSGLSRRQGTTVIPHSTHGLPQHGSVRLLAAPYCRIAYPVGLVPSTAAFETRIGAGERATSGRHVNQHAQIKAEKPLHPAAGGRKLKTLSPLLSPDCLSLYLSM
jgi:hypothetical protein